MEYILSALLSVLTVRVLVLMLIGTLVGIVAASIPGFTITMAVVLTMPFTFGMSPIEGLATMVAVYVGGYSGGLISGILLGIPGTPSSVCTVFDGHPMASKGEPGRALSLGVLSSFSGGMIGAIVCILFSVPLARFGLRFGPWERFSLILFALTLMASLGAKSITKGLIGGLFGLFLATVGIDPMGGRLRFTFGIPELTTGFSFLPILIGLFAVPAMMKAVTEIQKQRLNPDTKATGQSYISINAINIPWLQSAKELAKQWINVLRSGLIGALVGALPAAGGTTATFLSYDQAQKFSKRSDEFGEGISDGIIASEAANNGVAGGSLIPTLALGVPGSAVTAVMLGVLILHGITPGPLMIRNEPVLVYGVFVALVIAHFMMIGIHFVGMKAFIKVAQAPKYALVPVVLMLCVAGSYALNSTFFDVVVFLIAGVLGYLLTASGMPMGPVVLGVILGPMAETNLRRALMTNEDPSLFFTRPISLILIILSVGSIAFSIYQMRQQAVKSKEKATAA